MKLFCTPLFWLIFSLTAAGSAFLAFRYFPKAFPIVHLDLTMDRSQALEHAKIISTQFNLGPQNAQEATLFATDELVKTFVELEGGGKDALVVMMDNNLYQPYTWQVRHFKEFEQNQTNIYFTTTGIPYGFIETISENVPGAQLSSEQAGSLAREFAQAKPWSINFSQYKQVESSQEKQPSNRIDHIFLYERPNIKIGDGFYRLRIRVSGDHVSELTHFVKVPETFIRKYNNMRSANENLAYAAKLALMILYVLGGCMIGLFFLLRERWVLWKTPLWCAIIISGMTTLQNINEFPIKWMFYNTAYSTIGFLLQQLLGTFTEFIYWVFILFISFAAAESLTRKAFGNKIQLWKVWNRQVASSLILLGHTIAGYLLAPIMLLFIVLFYIYTTQFFGWWTPSNALFNPNILATYLPWWESISISLRAGFWEECLFRAVPLASAALLGQHFGKRNWWLAGAFILQAIIFGAAHANYPAQPAYARLVELLFVSSLFGGVYLRFGLLPAVITHYVYDIMWFSLPIFISHASNALINKLIVITLALVPLWIVLISRFKVGAWLSLPTNVYNYAWQPAQIQPIKKVQTTSSKPIAVSPVIVGLFLTAGIIAIGGWLTTTKWCSDGLSFTIDRNQALEKAKAILTEKNVATSDWYHMITPFTNYQQTEASVCQRFVWQEGGKEIYHQLLGTYVTSPDWLVRYVKFNGSLEERAEEHQLYLKPDGSIYRYIHQIAEDQPGETLDKDAAKKIALAVISTQFGLKPEELTDVSAIAQKHPNRLDWVFTFASPQDYPIKSGQARIDVTIGGNQVIDAYRYVHVPEEWKRADENKQLIINIIKQFCALCIYLLIIFGSLYVFMQWSIGIRLDALIPFSTVLSCIFLFELFNSWPTIIASFNTSQPFTDQLFRSFGMQIITLCMRAAMLGLLFSFTFYWRNFYQLIISPWLCYAVGCSIGFIAAGILSILEAIIPAQEPLWPNYTPLSFILPLNAGINSYLLNYISITILLLLIVIVLNTFNNSLQKNRLSSAVVILFFGMITMGLIYSDNLMLWGISGFLIGIVYLVSYISFGRYTLAIIPPAVAAYYSLYAVQQAAFNAMPYARAISCSSIFIMAVVAWIWSKKLVTR